MGKKCSDPSVREVQAEIWRKTCQLLHTVLVLTKDVQQKPWGDTAGPLRLQDHLPEDGIAAGGTIWARPGEHT